MRQVAASSFASELLEDLGVRGEQRGAVRERPVGIELRNLELGEGELGLAEIEPRARHRDRESDLHRCRQLGAVDGAADLERAVGSTDAALAVDHERQLVVASGDATIGAQLAQRENEVSGRVGGDRQRLAHDRNAAGTASGRHRMTMGQLGIVVEQLGCRDEVPGDLVGVLLAERLQLGAGALVEVPWLDALGDFGVVVTRTHREIRGAVGLTGRFALLVAVGGSSARSPPRRSSLRCPEPEYGRFASRSPYGRF